MGILLTGYVCSDYFGYQVVNKLYSVPDMEAQIEPHQELIEQIEAFCRAQGIAESTFGRQVVNDGKFVGRLRDGKGVTTTFGILGAALALIGCLAGNLLAFTAVLAQEADVPYITTLLSLNFETAKDLMVAFFDPIDILFYGLALYEGYRLSFRTITDDQLDGMVTV